MSIRNSSVMGWRRDVSVAGREEEPEAWVKAHFVGIGIDGLGVSLIGRLRDMFADPDIAVHAQNHVDTKRQRVEVRLHAPDLGCRHRH